jgi:hypothetical protein
MKLLIIFLVLSSALFNTGCSALPMAGGEALNPNFPFFETFDSGLLNNRWYKEIARESAINITTPSVVQPDGLSNACKINVAQGEIVNNGNRAEIAVYNSAQFLDTMYYAYDFMIPSDDPDSYDWQIISQWYQLPDFERGETFDGQAPHPPVTIVSEPGKILIKASIDQEETLVEAQWVKDTWYRIVIGIHFDIDSDGYIEAWFGPRGGPSSFKGKFQRPTLRNKAGAYFKMGLYRGGYWEDVQATSTNTIWIDNLAISRTVSEVQ